MLLFGDIVVVENNLIGVVCKCWVSINDGSTSYEIYVRNYNAVISYFAEDVKRYGVRHKYLDEDELEYQANYDRDERRSK